MGYYGALTTNCLMYGVLRKVKAPCPMVRNPTPSLAVLSIASKSTKYWDGFQARQNANDHVVKLNNE